MKKQLLAIVIAAAAFAVPQSAAAFDVILMWQGSGNKVEIYGKNGKVIRSTTRFGLGKRNGKPAMKVEFPGIKAKQIKKVCRIRGGLKRCLPVKPTSKWLAFGH